MMSYYTTVTTDDGIITEKTITPKNNTRLKMELDENDLKLNRINIELMQIHKKTSAYVEFEYSTEDEILSSGYWHFPIRLYRQMRKSFGELEGAALTITFYRYAGDLIYIDDITKHKWCTVLEDEYDI